jgi:predicted HTH domain antitoxin
MILPLRCPVLNSTERFVEGTENSFRLFSIVIRFKFHYSRIIQSEKKGKMKTMTRQVVIEYPESMPDVLQESKEQFEQEIRLAMALKMFEMKRLSSGQAAQLAGQERVPFLLSLHRYGIPMIDLADDELEEDVSNA